MLPLCNRLDQTKFASSCICLRSSSVRLSHPIHLSHPCVIYIRTPQNDFLDSPHFVGSRIHRQARAQSRVLYLRQHRRHITSHHHPLWRFHRHSPLPSTLGRLISLVVSVPVLHVMILQSCPMRSEILLAYACTLVLLTWHPS